MRSAEEMLDAVLSFARADDRILAVGMEGSRVNVNIPPDAFQDYDITYFVRSIGAFTGDDGWLARFGRPLLIQKPEDMELYPAEEPGYSYLMLFDDYVKLDLTLLEPKDLPAYLAQDRLRTILLDKCGLVGPLPPPTDADYWLQKPSARALDDCCNEFWSLAAYVTKGLCRRELLYAADHLHLLRRELLRMLGWSVGFAYGFSFSLGKSYKCIGRYLDPRDYEALLATYRQHSLPALWEALEGCMPAVFGRVRLLLRGARLRGPAIRSEYTAVYRRHAADVRPAGVNRAAPYRAQILSERTLPHKRERRQ